MPRRAARNAQLRWHASPTAAPPSQLASDVSWFRHARYRSEWCALWAQEVGLARGNNPKRERSPFRISHALQRQSSAFLPEAHRLAPDPGVHIVGSAVRNCKKDAREEMTRRT